MTDSFISKIENGRASFAFNCANSIPDNQKEEYKSHVKSFPMLVKTNGLGSAMAFLFAKIEKDSTYELMLDHILKWIIENDHNNFSREDNFKSLIQNIVDLNSSEYRFLTMEVLSFFEWLRRFADGLYNEYKEKNDGKQREKN